MADEFFLISQTVEDIIKNPTISRTNLVDLKLRLPDHLLQLIFSYLSFHDLVNVRLISKNWHRNTQSHVAFHFKQSLFCEKNPSKSSRNEFWDWIRPSLEVSKSKLINAEKRVLRVQFNHHSDIYEITKFLDENDFHEVYLRIKLLIVQCYCYYLPYIFQWTCLTILHLSNCGIEKHVLLGEAILPSLQELKLDNIKLCEETLSKFISKCPNIIKLSLDNCRGISFIVLPKFDGLKKLYVKLNYFHSFTNIQVIAPSLQVFHFIDRTENKLVAISMDIRACKMLQEFHLSCGKFPKGLDPEKLCSDFPHLETLLLDPCHTGKPLKISGPSLRKWILAFP